MLLTNYVILFVILISLAILYQKYLEKKSRKINVDEYDELRKYLLNDDNLDKSKKPILWIHVPYELNARNWLDFGSRNSLELNQPYMYLTTRSIIKNCDESFKIVIIDDRTFEKLIPNWRININLLADPIKCYVRQMALAKLIYIYGGMCVPISFLCFRDLISLYGKGTNNESMFVCENYDANITSTNKLFYPNLGFFGAKKENETVRELINFMEMTISNDYTAQPKFLGDFDKWCNNKITKGRMNLISGTDVGTKTIDGEAVIVETLLGEDYINFYGKTYGIWIPDRMILKRRHYEWFARMDADQIFKSQFILAKYFVLALSPDSKFGVIEPMENKEDWIGFWRIPINSDSHTLNIFGPKPIYLGNNIPRAKNAGNLP